MKRHYSAWEGKVRGSKVQGQPELISEILSQKFKGKKIQEKRK
jgi:hypothetical protein